MKAKLLSLVLILALISSHGKAGGAPVARAATSQAVNVSQLYDVARLLPLSNTNPEVMVYGINESGWAAGFSTASPSGYHAVLWQNTTPTDL